MKVENHEGVYLSQPRKSQLPCRAAALRWCCALTSCQPGSERLRAVWSGRSYSERFHPRRTLRAERCLCFMQNHAYEGGGVGGEGDEQSGHVAPGGQAEWWRRRARSPRPCLGKECPDSGTPKPRQDIVSPCRFPPDAREYEMYLHCEVLVIERG